MLNGKCIGEEMKTYQVLSYFTINALILRFVDIKNSFKCYFFRASPDSQATISISDLHNINCQGITMLSEEDVRRVAVEEKKPENTVNISFD